VVLAATDSQSGQEKSGEACAGISAVSLKRGNIRRQASDMKKQKSEKTYEDYVPHPRFGQGPQRTGIDPSPYDSDVHLHWNATDGESPRQAAAGKERGSFDRQNKRVEESNGKHSGTIGECWKTLQVELPRGTRFRTSAALCGCCAAFCSEDCWFSQ